MANTIKINKHKYSKTSKVTSTQIKYEEETGYNVIQDVATTPKIAAVVKYHVYMLEPAEGAPELDYNTLLEEYDKDAGLMLQVSNFLGDKGEDKEAKND